MTNGDSVEDPGSLNRVKPSLVIFVMNVSFVYFLPFFSFISYVTLLLLSFTCCVVLIYHGGYSDCLDTL